MVCPYLSGLYIKYCIAEKYDYVPSIYELREYCKARQHRVCRYYLRTDDGDKRAAAGRMDAVRSESV